MDIKLTHTGAIPLDDYSDYQYFLVISRKDKTPWLVYKCSSELRDPLGFIHKDKEQFVAWEPVNLCHDFNPCELKRLWLISPNFHEPVGWVFKDLEFPYKEFHCIIRDREFIDRVYKKGNCQFVAGDFFGAEVTLSPNEDGFFELFRLRRLGTDNEKFREIFLGRE